MWEKRVERRNLQVERLKEYISINLQPAVECRLKECSFSNYATIKNTKRRCKVKTGFGSTLYRTANAHLKWRLLQFTTIQPIKRVRSSSTLANLTHSLPGPRSYRAIIRFTVTTFPHVNIGVTHKTDIILSAFCTILLPHWSVQSQSFTVERQIYSKLGHAKNGNNKFVLLRSNSTVLYANT